MRKYRIKLLGTEYCLTDERMANISDSSGEKYAMLLNFLGDSDLTVSNIGRYTIDNDTALVLVSLFLSKYRGLLRGKYSVSLFGEKKDLDLSENRDNSIIYSAVFPFDAMSEQITMSDSVGLCLSSVMCSLGCVRIFCAENISGVDKELLKRLKIVKGVRDARYVIAAKREGDTLYVCSSDYPVPPYCYLLLAMNFAMPENSRIVNTADTGEAVLLQGGKIALGYEWI